MTKKIGFLGEQVRTGTVKPPSVLIRLSADVRGRIGKVKLMVLDVDGVLTDGRPYLILQRYTGFIRTNRVAVLYPLLFVSE